MANIANCSFRSRLAQNSATRTGTSGFHHNPQDFSERCGQSVATRQEFLRKNWEYLPAHRLRRAEKLSTKFETIHGEVAIDAATGQFAMGF